MIICSLVAFPLAISMITVGAISIETCSKEADLTNTNSSTAFFDSTSNQTTGNFDIFGIFLPYFSVRFIIKRG